MVRRVAMVFGIGFLLMGVLGLVSVGGMSMEADPTPAALLGLFPINLVHNIVHLLFGVWGLVASRSFVRSKQYAQIGGVVYLLLAVCGLASPSTFGMIPNGGNDIWLHAVIGLVLAGVGFTAREKTATPV